MEKRILAAILSFVMPGLGHFYSRMWVRGIVVFFGAVVIFYISSNITSISIHLIPSLSEFPFVHVIIGFVVAWDAYRLTPKEPGGDKSITWYSDEVPDNKEPDYKDE